MEVESYIALYIFKSLSMIIKTASKIIRLKLFINWDRFWTIFQFWEIFKYYQQKIILLMNVIILAYYVLSNSEDLNGQISKIFPECMCETLQ